MTKKKSFEESLTELETLLEKIESGELDLEKSLESFETATKLYKACKKELESAEKKIQLLNDSLQEEDLNL